MTDRIDLDDLEVSTDDDPADEPNAGDWFWRGEGDPSDEPDSGRSNPPSPRNSTTASAEGGGACYSSESDGGPSSSGAERTIDGSDPADPTATPAPHVPHANRNKPVGIPTESGGAGTGTGASRPRSRTASGTDGTAASDESPEESGRATGPRPAGSAADGTHGGGVDEMTLAFTYRAARRLKNPAFVFSNANGWADWIGIVGDVETHVITKFQRERGVEADFFTGSGTAPSERLREIDRNSMFYAERMVVVGVDERDEAIAAEAGWEYVPLETAAEKADWTLESGIEGDR
ncbi:hypothetical protein ACFQGT_09090 [Natrialbaceae archaeon GCM10025810]|uniref:DUF7124 domain-containing protein n=1 Tax=Halovalidus salilacus TaxID=3075124 RepID=UPI0036078DC9